MRLLLSILILAQLSVNCSAQKDITQVKHGAFKKFIMIDADVSADFPNQGDYFSSMIFSSKCDSVFCNCTSVICAVFYLWDECAILTKDTNNIFYSFFSLREVTCVKGQSLKKGDFLGLLMKNEEDGNYQMRLRIVDKKARELDEDKMWALLKLQLHHQ